MLRSARRFLGTVAPAEDLALRMETLKGKLAKHLPVTTADVASRNFAPYRELTMDEKLSMLDAKVANIEALREAGRPEEERIKNLPQKYGRAGRHPGYQWYGSYVKPEDKIPHVADRLGKYSTVAPTENFLHEWFQIRSDLNSQVFGSYFVQEPNREPDSNLNFESGDVLYENQDAASGVTLVRQLGTATFAYLTFNMAHVANTGRAVYPIGDEFCDIRADHRNYKTSWLMGLMNWGPGWHSLESLEAVAFVSPLFPLMALVYCNAIKMATMDQVVKMQFSADKELVFVTKMKGTFFTKPYEEVYETSHLQVLPPAVRTFDDTTKDQLLTISCMNTGESFIVYKDNKYWNPKISKTFKAHIHSMWS